MYNLFVKWESSPEIKAYNCIYLTGSIFIFFYYLNFAILEVTEVWEIQTHFEFSKNKYDASFILFYNLNENRF